MAKINISNFSCIDYADIDLLPLTVLIGPQASGKSVISKLIYYFYELIEGLFPFDLDFKERSFAEFIVGAADEFRRTFPSQAWGSKLFETSFTAGHLKIAFNRTRPRGKSEGKLILEFSNEFRQLYESFQQDVQSARLQAAGSQNERSATPQIWEIMWKIRNSGRLRLETALGSDYVSSKLFIPAGRSIFSNIGKALVAFEHGLDPLTVTFGQYFLAMREQLSGQGFFFGSSRSEIIQKNLISLRERLGNELFSGVIKLERNKEYIESSDGRKIPFSAMSSGQQELLPLWLALNGFIDGNSKNQQIYIEEPEAHLFPLSQGILTEYLATLLGAVAGQKMIITTHSPYILSTINNLLKAGSLSFRASKIMQGRVEQVIPKQSWLRPGTTSAYAIDNRKTFSIMGEDGLIDAEYLDGVSGQIAQNFNRLLEIEYA